MRETLHAGCSPPPRQTASAVSKAAITALIEKHLGEGSLKGIAKAGTDALADQLPSTPSTHSPIRSPNGHQDLHAIRKPARTSWSSSTTTSIAFTPTNYFQ
ncbi:hypothetical protein GS426_07925 [Rhodococcus hoagii]|nr:hypothetical protein [Prescottella equi]